MIGEKKTVVVTGASSFLGMHLAKSLQNKFRVVATVSQAPSEEIRKERIEVLKNLNIEIVTLDMREPESVKDLVLKYRPAFWFNHAGWVKDYASDKYDSNLADEIHLKALPTLVQTLKEQGALGLIGTGSSMEYSDHDKAHNENELCEPSTPYGAAKLRQTQLTLELAKKWGLNAAIVRVFIPFGEYDSPNKMMPALLGALSRGEKFPLSPGLQVRSFVPVEKLMELYLKVVEGIEQGKIKNEIFNGARGPALTLKDFILSEVKTRSLPCELLQFGAVPMRSSEVPFAFADTSKVEEFLGA